MTSASTNYAITHVTYVLPGPQRTLLECFRCFKLALPAVQSTQVPEGSGDSGTVDFCGLVPAAIFAVRRVVFPALPIILKRRLCTRPKLALVSTSENLTTKYVTMRKLDISVPSDE